MAYVSQETKTKIAPSVKSVCKKYGVKATLAVSNHMTLVLNIKSGSVDFINNFNKTVSANHYLSSNGFTPAEKSIDVNPYHYQDHFSGKALKFMHEVFTAMNSGNYDNSDVQSDYFDVGWYVNVNVGQWNKPYDYTQV